MKLSNHQIKEYLDADEKRNYSTENLQEVIKNSKMAFCESEAERILSGAEFLYQQSKWVKRRWWLLQGCILVVLYFLLEITKSDFFVRRYMGIAAPLFVIAVIPELWKNRSNCAIEIECSAYYSLRQIYTARMLLFALVDFVLLCSFFWLIVVNGKILIEEIVIQFFLPYIITCCICFRTLYSKKIHSEIFTLFLCIIWCGVWTQIVLNETIYRAISNPLWFLILAISIFYLGYCIYRGQNHETEVLEAEI